MIRFCMLLVTIVLMAIPAVSGENPIGVRWEPVGIGGGGGMFNPSISPHDPDLIFMSCDMGGLYRSTDGSETWRMIDGYSVRKVNCPAIFHPVNPKIVYVAARGGIKRSIDRGKTWHHVIGKSGPGDPDFPTTMAIDPNRPEIIWAHFKNYLGEKGYFLILSTDAGKTWRPHPGWPHRDKLIKKILFDPSGTPDHRRIFLLTERDLYRSDDDGISWEVKRKTHYAGDRMRDVAAAWDPKTKTRVFFITQSGRRVNGKYVGGVYRSTDGGDSWQQTVKGLETRVFKQKLQQYNLIAMNPANTQIIYVSSKGPGVRPPFCSTVWRSEDGGETWKAILFGDPAWRNCNVDADWLTLNLSWGWGGSALGLTCNPGDSDDVIFTDTGRAFRTMDGGNRWFPISTHRVHPEKDEWSGRGLEVSTAYEYYFDPNDPLRTYVSYTDFGLTRSSDRGKTWTWSGQGSPWTNSCYELAMDPDRPGVVFAAWGEAHDLPHWKMLYKGRKHILRFGGGVAKSRDHCTRWKALGRWQLPNAVATTIVLDPKSPENLRTIYAGFLDHGVYKSTNDGKTWSRKNKGLESSDNMNIWRLNLHEDGTLLCAKTIAYVNHQPIWGGLFRSTDGAETWEKVNKEQPLKYIWGVRMDPRDSNVIYVCCFDIPPEGFAAFGTLVPWPPSRGGGVFKTVDGGKTWKKILNEPWCWDISFDPNDPGMMYVGTFYGGVYRSIDAGNTWQPLTPLPFVCSQRVTVDPTDHKIIYVTTFGGGVWKGRLQ
jgi:photosystem II stability/assembly factor-like uncharacterized protein